MLTRHRKQQQRKGRENNKETKKLQQQHGSLKQLKQQLHAAAATKKLPQGQHAAAAAHACMHHTADGVDAGTKVQGGEGDQRIEGLEEDGGVPLEQTRVLTQEDFQRIRKLKVPSHTPFSTSCNLQMIVCGWFQAFNVKFSCVCRGVVSSTYRICWVVQRALDVYQGVARYDNGKRA